MKLTPENVSFISLCCFCCCLPVLNARCWIECSESEKRLTKPKCFLQDDGVSTFCNRSISNSDLAKQSIYDIEHISLLIKFTRKISILIIMNGIGSKLYLGASVQHDKITQVKLNGGNLFIRPELFYLLPNIEVLFLVSVKFQYFPYFAYSNRFLSSIFIHSYSYQGNHPNLLCKGRVSHLPQLELLSLTSDQFTNITDQTFSGLTALTQLTLERFRIPNPGLTFRPLVRLTDLYYISSNLTDISFLKRTPSLYGLRLLSFYDNNITSLQTRTFSRFSSLKILHLHQNTISQLENECFKGLVELTWLGLFDNDLGELNTTSFKGLVSLAGIDLGDNLISHLSSRMFEYLSNLEQIYLTSLPLQCKCSLQWISIINLDIYNSRCSSLPQHFGLIAIDPSIYVNCTPKLSYQCFNRSISCPTGSYCKDTADSYTCVCEEKNQLFVKSLNKCVVKTSQKTNTPPQCGPNSQHSCPSSPTCSTNTCPYCSCIPSHDNIL